MFQSWVGLLAPPSAYPFTCALCGIDLLHPCARAACLQQEDSENLRLDFSAEIPQVHCFLALETFLLVVFQTSALNLHSIFTC